MLVEIPLFLSYQECCTTAAVKKTGTPSFCTPTWLMIFAFFLYGVLKLILLNIIFLEENKKLQT